MPIYEYVCSDCGHEIEKLQISAPGFRLSGSGWYETDFKSDKQKNLSKGDSAEKSSAAGSKDSKPGKSATAKGASGKEAAA
jgi:predicted nucleic acid-binding Zn ribbon protein